MIEVRNLTRYYGSFHALENVSFRIDEGEIIGLLGLNGAGKSTTLKILAGLITPSEGCVLFDDVDVTENPESVRGRIGYLPEDPPLYKDMTVVAFLRHIGRLKGMTAAAVERRLPDTVALAQLQGREDQIIGTLSHGYRKRVGIAQAVLHDPKLVILDEPISGLDPRQIVGMREVIRGLSKGRAVIVSSHILGEISQTCDRILLINNGHLEAEGTEDELAAKAGTGRNRLVFTLVGDAAMIDRTLNGHSAVTQSATHPNDNKGRIVREVTFQSEDGRLALLPDLLKAGIGVWEMQAPEDDLEDIFLGLTGDAT